MKPPPVLCAELAPEETCAPGVLKAEPQLKLRLLAAAEALLGAAGLAAGHTAEGMAAAMEGAACSAGVAALGAAAPAFSLLSPASLAACTAQQSCGSAGPLQELVSLLQHAMAGASEGMTALQ